MKIVSNKNGDLVGCEIVVNVLGYHENDQWVALALEMDLRGYGESFEEAVEDLDELIEMQLSFALQMKQPEMILKTAAPNYWDSFREARDKVLRAVAAGKRVSRKRKNTTTDFAICSRTLPLPPASRGLDFAAL